jgi:hypothetical protein
MHDASEPTGGEKHCYEHVDILNAAGFEAYAIHLLGDPYACFDTQTPVLSSKAFWDLFDRREDFLVVPETLGPRMSVLPGKKVIFNKNLYLGLRAFPPFTSMAYATYTQPDVVAMLTVSDHNDEHLRFAFPGVLVRRVYAGIDPRLYAYRSLPEKTRQIVIVDKGEEIGILAQILRARIAAGVSSLRDYRLTVLKGFSPAEAAQVIGESVLLVSLSTHEGLPRTILEAMACGTLVAACGVGPLREILPPEYAFEPGDLIGITRHIEAIAAAFPDHLDSWSRVIETGRQTAAAFSVARQRQVVVDVWQEILAHDAACTR